MSQPYAVFDSKLLYGKESLVWDEAITNNSGNATSIHATVDASVTMHVEAADTVIRQTKMRFNYQPGKGSLIMMTGNFHGVEDGVTKRLGYFDASNGLFFQVDGSGLSVVRRKATTDTEIAQSDFNLDTLDGTGISGIELDLTKVQIFVIDFQWLGAGRVRFGFELGGMTYYCHEFLHANANESVYMSTPNLPCRYEIVSTTGTSDLEQICCQVTSEGGNQLNGILRSVAKTAPHLDADVADTIYAATGVRLRSTHLGVTVKFVSISVIAETNDAFRWVLSLNPTIAGTFTYTSLANSAVETALGTTANTVSNLGTVITQGYGSQGTRSAAADLENALSLGSTIAGVRDTIVLSIMPITNGLDVHTSINWRELPVGS